LASFLFLAPIHLYGQYATIEIEDVQVVRSVAAVVHDPTGSPIPGVSVEEFRSDWKESLRSTKTNTAGGFTFAPVTGRCIYYLQFRMNGFDPLRVRLRLDPKRGKKSTTQNGSRYLAPITPVIRAPTPDQLGSRTLTLQLPGFNQR
jgi:Carboxypeptidase regulatory-like domain